MVGRVEPEPVRLFFPGLADELAGREAAHGLQAPDVVVGVHAQLQAGTPWTVAQLDQPRGGAGRAIATSRSADPSVTAAIDPSPKGNGQ